MVSSDLVGPILVTLFCCLPFGIVSIVYASQVPTKVAANDIEGAKLAAKTSKTWMVWGLITGLIGIVLLIFLQVVASVLANNN